jgi:hypothetical protein
MLVFTSLHQIYVHQLYEISWVDPAYLQVKGDCSEMQTLLQFVLMIKIHITGKY